METTDTFANRSMKTIPFAPSQPPTVQSKYSAFAS